MINIKTVAAIAAAVASVGVTAHSLITTARTTAAMNKAAIDNEPTLIPTMSPEARAFHKAQDEMTTRMLAGKYDDKSDDEYRFDFSVIFNTYLAYEV